MPSSFSLAQTLIRYRSKQILLKMEKFSFQQMIFEAGIWILFSITKQLIEQSSYFQGLLGGSFSESSSDYISIQWNLETFIDILKCIYGCPLDVTSDNFLALFEGALYFGVERLILECRTWFSDVCFSKDNELHQIHLEDLIHIWNFGLEHANDFVPQFCASYLARNFMWAMSHKSFVNIPYNLLLECVKHPSLTVDSEMHLSNALLIWIDANIAQLESSNRAEDDLTILKEIQISILPLWFAAGKRRSSYFSKLSDESVNSILRLVKVHPACLIKVLEDVELKHLRIRLTEYSEKVNLSGCPQMTSAILLLSVLDSSHCLDPTSRKIFECLDKDQSRIPLGFLPILSFEAVQEVNISKCHALHLESAIECFSKSFPSLRTIKAAYHLNFKTLNLHKLVQKCPMLCEVDLTVDPSPVIPTKVSVVSSSSALMPLVLNKSIAGDSSLYATSVYHSGPSPSNITKLTLEGRSDMCDADLEFISKYCVSLGYINIKGCVSVTDVCISNLIQRCVKLQSIIVCDTSFGVYSIRALCSEVPYCNSSALCGKRNFNTLASNLQMLHMACCYGVDGMYLLELMCQARKLKSLCLSGTQLADKALYNFSGSSLEMLDVSDTMISGAALAYMVHGNSGLKYLNARGCKNLFQQESNGRGIEFSSYPCAELFAELGRTCKLEEIVLGWGFSFLSLEVLKPAIKLLHSITVGLGGSLGEDALRLLPTTCPMLESVVLYFQVISDSIIINILESLRRLQVLAICHCLGDLSISSFKLPLPNLRKLKLERVTPWMTNNDLVILTQNCSELVELSLVGCTLLSSDSQLIISQGWPGLISLHLEECGGITAYGVTSLFNCIALEDLLLHVLTSIADVNMQGPGIPRNFILDAASKMPMLRLVSLDLCDASDGDFEIPDYADRYSLSTVKITKCKSKNRNLCHNLSEARRQSSVHKESLVLVWNSKNLIRTVVKERL
ncbi:hypothetical protein CUMW_006220 [Citrus unshiu]|nr:hypothetical protein CUMW_006220 [Citrus unshiu]